MRHTPEVNGASSPPLLYAECASPLETGLFPVHARWCPRGSRREREGATAAHVTRLTGQDAGPYNPRRCVGRRRMKPLREAAAPRAPDPRGERRAAPDSAPYLDPSFQNTAPPSQPAQHQRGPQIPRLFWTLHPLWTLFYYFC